MLSGGGFLSGDGNVSRELRTVVGEEFILEDVVGEGDSDRSEDVFEGGVFLEEHVFVL